MLITLIATLKRQHRGEKRQEAKKRCGQTLSRGDAESSLSNCEGHRPQVVFMLFAANDKMLQYHVSQGRQLHFND